MAGIVVVGSINMDLVARVSRMPAEGETLLGTGFHTNPGGKGANQAVCAARLGAAVQIVGRVGNDLFAQQLRSSLNDAGVDTRSVQAVEGSSGTALITVDANGANTIIVVPGANVALDPAALARHLPELRAAGMLLTQLETPLATAVLLGELAERSGIPYLLDPAPAQQLPAALLRRVTWLTPNEAEACTLLRGTGGPVGDRLRDADLNGAAQRLLTTGVRNVILKLGERGAFLAGQDVRPLHVPAFRVSAVDTTAAGDAFNGGFAFALSQEPGEPESAARFASAVAAVSVTRPGAQPSMPTFEEVRSLMASQSAV